MSFRPLRIGLWDPFQMADQLGGDPITTWSKSWDEILQGVAFWEPSSWGHQPEIRPFRKPPENGAKKGLIVK